MKEITPKDKYCPNGKVKCRVKVLTVVVINKFYGGFKGLKAPFMNCQFLYWYV